MEKILKSKKFIVASAIVGIFIIALVSFAMGAAVGFHKAKFSFQFGENYERNFMGSKHVGPMGMMPFPPEFEGRGMRNGHGVAGTIISISENSLIIKDRDGKENTISVSDKTIINLGRDTVKIGDLKNDEEIVVIGKPGDSGVVNADLIRVFDKNTNNNQNNDQQ
ncbi:MAG: hypothetical protein WC906_02070 [Parcubacteria group bacterium]|jgi:hypothetical protein